MFLAPHCAYTIPLQGDRMQALFPGCRDGCCWDGCCVHPAIRHVQVSCFWKKRVWHRAGCRLQASAVNLPSMQVLRLRACCLRFSALHCAYTFLLPAERMQLLFSGYRDGCCWDERCGPRRAEHEQVRCFWYNLCCQDGSLPSRRLGRLAACCLKFSALHRAYTTPLQGGPMQVLFSGYRDDCRGPRRGDREQARCFWNNRAWRRACRMLPASAVNLSSNQDSPYQACCHTFPLQAGWKPVFLRQQAGLPAAGLPRALRGQTRWYLHSCFSCQICPPGSSFARQRSPA